jgi:hypothetical protein
VFLLLFLFPPPLCLFLLPRLSAHNPNSVNVCVRQQERPVFTTLSSLSVDHGPCTARLLVARSAMRLPDVQPQGTDAKLVMAMSGARCEGEGSWRAAPTVLRSGTLWSERDEYAEPSRDGGASHICICL